MVERMTRAICAQDLTTIQEFREQLRRAYPELVEKFDALRINGKLALIEEYHALKDRALTNWVGQVKEGKI